MRGNLHGFPPALPPQVAGGVCSEVAGSSTSKAIALLLRWSKQAGEAVPRSIFSVACTERGLINKVVTMNPCKAKLSISRLDACSAKASEARTRAKNWIMSSSDEMYDSAVHENT
jgi:hypothetical protein